MYQYTETGTMGGASSELRGGAPASGAVASGAVLLGRVALSSALCFSALLHWNNAYGFLASFLQYRILDFGVAAVFLSCFIPSLQVVVGLAVVLAPRAVSPLYVAGGLFAMFAVVQSTALLRGLPIDCGCFASLSHRVSLGTILPTAILCALSLVCIALQWRMNSRHA